jgi:hypothetical protein
MNILSKEPCLRWNRMANLAKFIRVLLDKESSHMIRHIGIEWRGSSMLSFIQALIWYQWEIGGADVQVLFFKLGSLGTFNRCRRGGVWFWTAICGIRRLIRRCFGRVIDSIRISTRFSTTAVLGVEDRGTPGWGCFETFQTFPVKWTILDIASIDMIIRRRHVEDISGTRWPQSTEMELTVKLAKRMNINSLQGRDERKMTRLTTSDDSFAVFHHR